MSLYLEDPAQTSLRGNQSDMYAYKSLRGAFVSIARQGPQELLRGFMASTLRDAPYAGLFVVFYEGIKREASGCLFLLIMNMNHI